MKTAKKLFSLFTITMCFALIFTECTPIASDGGVTPSNTGGSGGGGPKTVTLTLDLDGGTGIAPFIKGEENDGVTAPQNPTRRGYDFDSWNPSLPATFSKADDGKNFVAVWKAKSVTYTLYNKDKTSVYTTLTGDHDTNITRPNAPAPDLTNRMFFDKWEPELPEKFDVDKPTEYVAKYKFVPNENVVLTLKLEGGTLPKGQDEHPQGKQGDALSVQNPTKTGYTFKGWSPNLPATFPATNETYTAQWQAKTYAVKYNSNGGGTAPADTNRTYGQQFTLATSAGMSKTGHDFVGWKKDNAGTAYGSGANITDAALTQIDGEITFRAEWTLHTYSVTYNTNGGTNPTGAKTAYNINDVTFSLPTPTKNGYTFKGWYENSSLTGNAVTQIATGSTGNRTFWAKWEVARSTMTIDQAIAAINALPSGQTLDVVLGSDTTQAVFDNKNAELKTALQNCKGKVNLDMTKTGVTSIGDNAFTGCTSLVSVVIPDSVRGIGRYAFYECTSLASVNIPNGVISIMGRTFDGCTSLASVAIPDSVTSIGDNAFIGCTSLEINVSAGNKNYASQNGALYDKNMTKLIWWSGASGNISIPDSVTSIWEYAFYKCTSLSSVVIPDSVTSIGGHAFRGCTSLASVTIGNGVTSIGTGAFHGCSKLVTINYTGTKNNWNRITFFDVDLPNSPFFNSFEWKRNVPAVGVTCSDGVTYKFVGSSSSPADSKLGDPL